MRTVRGVLVDLDGVVRIWRDTGSRQAEVACALPPGTIARVAYGGRFDLAHHGLLCHEDWVAGVRDRLVEEFGAAAALAADLWSADRGEIDHTMTDVLRRLRAEGLCVATLTNNTSALAQDLALHKIGGLFDTVVNSADIAVCKPAPAAFRIAAAQMGLPLHSIVFTDDNPTNVEAAALLGMHAHLHTSTDAFTDYLSGLGVDFPLELAPPTCTREPFRREAGPLVDRVLAVFGQPTAPPAAAAESDAHSGPCHVRYLATMHTPHQLADSLSADNDVLAAVADNGTVGLVLADGTVAEVRVLAAGTDARLPAGDPAAWVPGSVAVPADMEHLPVWTSQNRHHAGHSVQRSATTCAWQLTQLAAAYDRRDLTAAATALDRARAAVISIAAVLARHHPVPATGTAIGRYLGPGTRALLATSWRANLTTSLGLAEASAAVVMLLRQARYTARYVLDTELAWPWQQLTASLRPLLGHDADLAPHPANADALYNAELAELYDHHRPIPAEMATGLHTLAQRWLHRAVVLELGAGTGRITAHLAGQAIQYLVVEYSPAMASQLTTRALPDVTTLLGDAHHIPVEDDSIEVVVEHETLPFTDAPTKVMEEILRVLRPGGLLIRILVHPIGVDPSAQVETVYRATAFANGPGPLFTGKGTDALLTDMLARSGWVTHEHTLASWKRTRTVSEVLAPIADRAWPYLHQAIPEQHAAGTAAAHRAATDAAGPDGRLYSSHRLYVLVTRIGDPS